MPLTGLSQRRSQTDPGWSWAVWINGPALLSAVPPEKVEVQHSCLGNLNSNLPILESEAAAQRLLTRRPARNNSLPQSWSQPAWLGRIAPLTAERAFLIRTPWNNQTSPLRNVAALSCSATRGEGGGGPPGWQQKPGLLHQGPDHLPLHPHTQVELGRTSSVRRCCIAQGRSRSTEYIHDRPSFHIHCGKEVLSTKIVVIVKSWVSVEHGSSLPKAWR